MKRANTVSILLLGTFVLSSCSRSSEGSLVRGGNNNQRDTSSKSLSVVAEVIHSFGRLVPVDAGIVRLMKLPVTREDGTFKARQVVLNVTPNEVQRIDVGPVDDARGIEIGNDVRGIFVGDKDTGNIILGRIDTRRDSFENFRYLTSPGGELRCIVYTPSGRSEERIVDPGDPIYGKAIKDFEDQVAFWIGIEPKLKQMLRDK